MAHIDRHIAVSLAASTTALSVALMVAPFYFPNIPRWLLAVLFWGGISISIIGTIAIISLLIYGREPRPTTIRDIPARIGALDLRWIILMQVGTIVVAGVLFGYGWANAPSYVKGLSNEQRAAIKSDLIHIKPRTVVIECNPMLMCDPLENGFNYLFNDLGWPHVVAHNEIPKWAVGLQLSPNDEVTRAIKTSVERSTGLEINLLGKPLRGSAGGRISLIIGSEP